MSVAMREEVLLSKGREGGRIGGERRRPMQRAIKESACENEKGRNGGREEGKARRTYRHLPHNRRRKQCSPRPRARPCSSCLNAGPDI